MRRHGLTFILIASLLSSVGADVLKVDQGTDTVKVWSSENHVYLKGNLGVGDAQLLELDAWIHKEAPNWTVLFCEQASGERFTEASGRSYSGMDAVEHAMGKGLSNQTDFGNLRHPSTGESNGAFFILFLKERKFSYFGADAYDKRRLGESAWKGRLDGPAVSAMRSGGRVVDAARDTIQHIDAQLKQAITRGVEQKRKAEQQKRLAYQEAEQNVAGAEQSLKTLSSKLQDFRTRYPEAKGALAFPDVTALDSSLSSAKQCLADNNLDGARNLVQGLRKGLTQIDGDLLRYEKDIHEMAQVKKMLSQVNPGNNQKVGRILSNAQRLLEKAERSHAQADPGYRSDLTAAAAGYQSAISEQDRVRLLRKHRKEQSLMSSIIGGLVTAVLGLFGNIRKRKREREAKAMLKTWRQALDEKTDGLLSLMTESRTVIGNRITLKESRLSGRTLELSEDVIRKVDELFIMSSCVDQGIKDANQLINPRTLPGVVMNTFSGRRYKKAMRILHDQPIEFAPEKGLELMLRGQPAEHEKLLGKLEDYEPFRLSFSELIEAFNQRANIALQELGQLETTWNTISTRLDRLQEDLQRVEEREQWVKELDNGAVNLYLPSMYDTLLPSAQDDYDQAQDLLPTDPVTALDTWILDGERKVDDMQCMMDLLETYDADFMPAINQQLEALGTREYDVEWFFRRSDSLMAEGDACVADAVGHKDPEAFGEFAGKLKQLAERLAIVHDSAVEFEALTLPHISQVEKSIAATRASLLEKLEVADEQALREPGYNPDELLAEVKEDAKLARATIHEGGADVIVEYNRSLNERLDGVQELLDRTLEIHEAYPARNVELHNRRQHLLADLDRHVELETGLEQSYAAGALTIAKRDPSWEDPIELVSGFSAQAKEALDKAEQVLDQAKAHYLRKEVFQSAAGLDEAQVSLEFIDSRYECLRLQDEALRKTMKANLASWTACSAGIESMATANGDDRTRQSSRRRYESLGPLLKQGEDLLAEPRKDPFHNADQLAELASEIEDVQDLVENDWNLFELAGHNLDKADRQLRDTGRLAHQSAHDRIPDSGAIRNAVNAYENLDGRVNSLRHDYGRPHNDWFEIDQQAEQLANEAAKYAGILKDELHKAQTALDSLHRAAEEVRQAANWKGSHRVRIIGHPGQEVYLAARDAMLKGDYFEAHRGASDAVRVAMLAIQQAQQEVMRKEREQRRRAEAAQRLAARRRASRSSSIHRRSRSIGGGLSIGSRSSSSRSSFSSGSGVSRSGW